MRETDHWVEGRFVRSWTPEGESGAPILLLHDSLGSVGLWRSFPQALAAASGRRVIAYDRLGYGRSDPYPGAQPFDFISVSYQSGLKACPARGNARGRPRPSPVAGPGAEGEGQ